MHMLWLFCGPFGSLGWRLLLGHGGGRGGASRGLLDCLAGPGGFDSSVYVGVLGLAFRVYRDRLDFLGSRSLAGACFPLMNWRAGAAAADQMVGPAPAGVSSFWMWGHRHLDQLSGRGPLAK
ncbi:hypothetical protein ILYODFUR_034755 [Ilyodon furcidens]|uniref:Secreted protein n=1 Tax=Ilyodon furcidens TaxID=33524 RepID=A0ABV0TPM0_9TELE